MSTLQAQFIRHYVGRRASAIAGAATMNQKKNKSLAAVAVIAAFLFTGCSSADQDKSAGTPAPELQQSEVFEFKTPAYGSPGELTLQIPQDLKDVAGTIADDLLVTSVNAKAREMNSARYCAVDLTVHYAVGATASVTRPVGTEFGPLSAKAELEAKSNGSPDQMDAYLRANGFDSVDAFQADYDKAHQAKLDAPNWQNAASRIAAGESSRLANELDPADPQPGTYISNDLQTLTFVQSCAETPSDDSNAGSFQFPYRVEGQDDSTSTFASFKTTVMKDGSLGIREPRIRGYKLDSNGYWLED